MATWILAFVYVVGLIHRCQSVNSLASFFNKDSLLQRMTGIQKVSQSALSHGCNGQITFAADPVRYSERALSARDAVYHNFQTITSNGHQSLH
ncbi:hypothetical protein NZD89_20755 [Alicyclobacillus fastidiosus]|uniref:Uncharacterized protein n=1 Tax=Alicyclobacillus fastidiosus TaxID=392011 RepID=A0ABY6ZCZ1_9BACL|nr:hypothetical protein [Alicyclobacillus fastidiosus]WAH40707.1 hypothetical protein NZD89_20755 [Alicyclobacillus fastidiosus]